MPKMLTKVGNGKCKKGRFHFLTIPHTDSKATNKETLSTLTAANFFEEKLCITMRFFR